MISFCAKPDQYKGLLTFQKTSENLKAGFITSVVDAVVMHPHYRKLCVINQHGLNPIFSSFQTFIGSSCHFGFCPSGR
jgi:hypothetical protein